MANGNNNKQNNEELKITDLINILKLLNIRIKITTADNNKTLIDTIKNTKCTNFKKMKFESFNIMLATDHTDMSSFNISDLNETFNKINNLYMFVDDYITNPDTNLSEFQIKNILKEIKNLLLQTQFIMSGQNIITMETNLNETIIMLMEILDKKYNTILSRKFFPTSIPLISVPVNMVKSLLIQIMASILQYECPSHITTYTAEEANNSFAVCAIYFSENIPINILETYPYNISIKKSKNSISIYFPTKISPDCQEIHTKMTNKNILIVDDEEIITDVIKGLLNKFSNNIIIKNNAFDALNYIKENKDNISFIFLDLNMPIMDGENLYLQIKKEIENVPVILISGDIYRIENMRKTLYSIDRILNKPFGVSELYKVINSIQGEIV